MKLKHGFNIVEKEFEPFENSSTILEFLGKIRRKEQLPSRITVIGLDILLSNSANNNEMVEYIRNILRNGQSNGLIRPNAVIQFKIDGKISKDTSTKIKVKNDYIDIESLFSSQIIRMAPDWIYAVR